VEAEAGSRLVGGRIAGLDLPTGVIIAAIRRGERLLVPSGNDRVEPGDEVLIVTETAAAARLDTFLAPS
jgi:trk system potassium uptake protein TrkA